MTISWAYAVPVLQSVSVSAVPPGLVLSVDSTLGRVPDLFDATVVEVSADPPRLQLRKVDSAEEVTINFAGLESLQFRRCDSVNWEMRADFSSGWLLLSTKPR
jgi:hypothetical protein